VRRAVVLAILAALVAAAPSPAARKPCAKRAACAGKVGAARGGVPVSWTKRTALPGGGSTPVGGQPGDSKPPARPGAPAPPPPPPPPPDDPRYVQVVSDDSDPERWTLTLSRSTVLAGTVSVEFNNRFAEDPHDLWVKRGGVEHAFDPVEDGEAVTRELPLTPGTWKLWCDIGDHEQRGMVAQLTVVAG
jgi:hypothetical protein